MDWGKRMYKITAVLKSPLMIGGKTLDSNYRESKNYIPGGVLRAAYAKAIIERCSYKQENYLLCYMEKEDCKTCQFKTICKNFSEIVFPTLYPLGSTPYPITAREKKYKEEEEKGIFDILKSRLIMKNKLRRESEWQRLEGLHKDEEKIELVYSIITRTAINYQCNTAKEGALYTQNVISGQYLAKDKKIIEAIFTGEIPLSLEEKEELNHIKILHIGADITRGFGLCQMCCEEEIQEDTSEAIKKRIEQFNHGIEGQKPFVILDFLTDAYLGLDEIGEDTWSQTKVSDEEFKRFLEEKIGLSNEKYHLFKVFKLQELLFGFDTSKKTEKEMRRKGHIVIKAGAVFAYQYQAKLEDIKEEELKELCKLEMNGIGNNVKHGFGKVRVCDEFHMKYDVLKEENICE